MEENVEVTENEPEDKYNISIKVLGSETKQLISANLNPPKVIPTDEGLMRDWQGLAELVAIPGERIYQLLSETDPTSKILTLWQKDNPTESTIDKLFSYFERLDRYDIIDDIKDLVDKDIQKYKTTGAIEDTNSSLCCSEYDGQILTRDDYECLEKGQPLPQYDAFVLFADEDMDFATKLIDTMEKEYNLKFCTKHRDLIGGTFEIDAIIKLIQERCLRLIVIFSDFFFKSPYNKYFTSFAQSVGIDQSTRKIVPCIYTACDIPMQFRIYFMLDYKRYERSGEVLFWEKLRDSVRIPKHKPNPKAYENGRPIIQGLPNRKVPPAIKPALVTNHEVDATLKVKKEGVKFNSMIDINGDNENIVSDNGLNTSTSSNSLSTISQDSKKSKKMNWLKKILHNDNKLKNGNVDSSKEKKHFFSRHIKRKVAVAN